MISIYFVLLSQFWPFYFLSPLTKAIVLSRLLAIFREQLFHLGLLCFVCVFAFVFYLLLPSCLWEARKYFLYRYVLKHI